MKSAPDVTNVVEACAEGRQERLEGMLQQLELCEKVWGGVQCRRCEMQAGSKPLPAAALCLLLAFGRSTLFALPFPM